MQASPQALWASIPLPLATISLGHFTVVFLSQSCPTKGPSSWHGLDNNLGYC